MRTTRIAVLLWIPLAGSLTVGCAPAYHRYDGCRVPCQYCPAAPLPFHFYDECACHARAVQPYLSHVSVPTISEPTSEPPQPAQLPD